MTQYEVEKNEHSVMLTEHQYKDNCATMHTAHTTYYTLSKAVEAFEDFLTGDELFFSVSDGDRIVVAAVNKDHFSEVQGFEGPYDSTLMAYGAQDVTRIIRAQVPQPHTMAERVSPGAKLLYDYTIYADNFEYSRLRTELHNIPINIYPLSSPEDLKAGEPVFLRVLGETEDICVFDSPEELIDYSHLLPMMIIPIGTYQSEIPDQDSSVVLTGRVSRMLLLSDQVPYRYMLTVETMDMEVELDVSTNYEIKTDDFVLAKCRLSAFFPR